MTSKEKRENGCEGVLSPCHKGFAVHTHGCCCEMPCTSALSHPHTLLIKIPRYARATSGRLSPQGRKKETLGSSKNMWGGLLCVGLLNLCQQFSTFVLARAVDGMADDALLVNHDGEGKALGANPRHHVLGFDKMRPCEVVLIGWASRMCRHP